MHPVFLFFAAMVFVFVRFEHVRKERLIVLEAFANKNRQAIANSNLNNFTEISASCYRYWNLYYSVEFEYMVFCFWVFPARKMFPRELLDYISEK
jgi:starvation-inducible outer membrane lipoprotein